MPTCHVTAKLDKTAPQYQVNAVLLNFDDPIIHGRE